MRQRGFSLFLLEQQLAAFGDSNPGGKTTVNSDNQQQFAAWLATESVSAQEPHAVTKLDINKFLGHLAQDTTGKTRYRAQ